MKEKVTISDIAEQMGISKSTVSRALKNNPNISMTVKEKVFAQAKQMGYGRVPALVDANAIAIIVPEINSAFYAEIIRAFNENIDTQKYLVSIYCSYHSEKKEREILQNLDLEKLACLVISKTMDSSTSEHIQALQESNIPVLMFHRVDYSVAGPKFVVDEYMDAYNAMKHLISAGYKRIALAAKHINCPIYKDRERAYRDVLQEEGIAFDSDLIIYSEFTPDDITEVLTRFVTAENRPDAIMVPDYYAALQAINLAKTKGINVPNQLGIFSFTEEKSAKFSTPTITSINRPLSEIGRDMAKLASRILSKESYDETLISAHYKSNIIVRGSTLNRR